jgi:hypothetical protein
MNEKAQMAMQITGNVTADLRWTAGCARAQTAE